MTERRFEFKRMVVGLPSNPRDYPGVDMAAKLAGLLRISVAATFAEETGLIDIAGLPGARELRPLTGWQPLNVSALAREMEHAASVARRLFDETTGQYGIESTFELIKGSAADVVCSRAARDDIIVVIQPSHPVERITYQFTRLLQAAFGAPAAVMIVPSRPARSSGSIVAVAEHADDPSISTGLAIAATANEQLVILPLGDLKLQPQIAERAKAAGVPLKFVSPLPRSCDASSLAASLSGLNGRLVVMGRGKFGDSVPVETASSCRIPVLVLEPDGSRLRAA